MNTRIIRLLGLTFVIASGTGVQSGAAQQTTERFIPIGYSPGLSGVYNWIGEITGVDVAARTVTVRNDQGDRTVRITDTTDIWVDNTSMQRTNSVGTIASLVVGRRAEIKYVDYARPEVAAWIKVAGS